MIDDRNSSLNVYRSIFENAIGGILVVEIESKKFMYVNRAICDMFGYSCEESLALSMREIHPPEQLRAILETFESQARGEITLAHSVPCLRKSGNIFLADIHASKVTIDGIECNVNP